MKFGLIVEQLYGFSWNRDALTSAGAEMINDITHGIKGSEISKGEIEGRMELFRDAFYDRSDIFPSRWEIWRSTITQYHLYELDPLAFWATIIHSLETKHT